MTLRNENFFVFFLVLDILFLLSLRLGYESTRMYMNDSIRAFFACFRSTNEPTDIAHRLHEVSINSNDISFPLLFARKFL